MDELWTIRPVKSSAGWTMRPVLKWRRFGTIRPMNTHLDKDQFRVALKRRLKNIRENMPDDAQGKWTQKRMAAALGVKSNTYSKWEQPNSDKNFPLYLLPAFCEITGFDPWTILTDQSPAFSPEKRKAI